MGLRSAIVGCFCAALLLVVAACGGDSAATAASGSGNKHPSHPAKDAGASGAGANGGSKDAAPSNRGDAGADASSQADGAVGPSGGHDAGDGTAGMIVDHPPPGCEDVVANKLPKLLSCTGLYSDIEQKAVTAGLHEYAPAHQLWSDGATKQRWLALPAGTRIDSSAADAWKFPVGTKLFKEFSWDGHRVETRLFWKTTETLWLKTSYHWNDAESDAERFDGGDVDVAGHTYYIPSAKECEQCHKGRFDRILGFEMISLGLDGAQGMTLSELMKQGLLTENPASSKLQIGDDGTGKAAPALAWLHVNCGVSCHNSNSTAEGYASTLRLRLPSTGLDGSSSAGFEAIKSTVGVTAHTPRWLGKTRITPGSPADSLLYELASKRDLPTMKDQMPPIASRVVDADGSKLVEDWITSMPAK